MSKLCVRCGKNKPTVPDNTRMGRPILRVCSECHAIGLRNSFEFYLQQQIRHIAQLEFEGNSILEGTGFHLDVRDPLNYKLVKDDE